MASRLLAIFVLAALCGLALGDLQTAGTPGDLTVYIGGDQSPSSGPGGFGLTSFDVPESSFASVNWGCNGVVRRIQVSGDSVWLAGDFTECDNSRYGPLTRYDISTGTYNSVLPDGAYFTNAFDTIPNKWGRTISIRDVKLYKGKLYIAGLFAINFTATNEVAYNVAALDTRTGEWQLFGEGVNGRVNSIWVQDEQTFLLGGRFTRTGYKGTQDPTKVVFFRDPGFAVWHTDHPIYGTGYMSYTIGFQNNNFDKGFAKGWRSNMKENDYEVYAIWRGLLQLEPQGEILNPPVFTPEPERLTIVLAGSFPGGVIYQQDALPWHRANGGLWGGPVYTLEPCPEHNAFFFGGDFTHSGNENITLGTPQNAVTQWNYQNLWHQAGSVLPPHFDWLQGGVTGGPVYGLSWADDLGLLFVTGGFSAPYSRIAYFELDTQVWLPVGEGSEFSADLYSIALVSTGPHQDSWSGSWSSQLYPGNFYTCVLGNQFFGGFGFASFEGQLTADGLGAYGTFATAGASDAPNRGQFAFTLAADLLSFSGWYSLDGQQGRFPMTGSRIAFTTPDLITDCLATDDSAGGSAAGQWSLPDGTTLLDLCLVGVDSVTASSSQNAGRYYTGQAVFPGKIIQAQWYDATGYGMSLFLQATDDLMIEHWFAGDVSALDYTSDCVLDLTCGVSVWSRTIGNATDADCASQAAFGAWVGTWSGCGTIAGSEISLRPDGTGLVHGYFMGGLLEGRLVTPYRLEGYYSSAGFDDYVGAIRGPFAFEIDVGAPWEGRSFRGNFTMDVFANNQPLKHPYYFTCNSQRIRNLLPLASNTFLQLPSAGATVEGVWLKPDGTELAICVEEPGSTDAATVVASTTSPTKRFYMGDAYTIKATGIEFFETYSASNVVGRDTASLNFWNADGSRGLALFRRVSATQLEESWFEIGTARANRVSFVLNDCTAATCQFPDRGSNGALYTYSRPVTKDECQRYQGYQSQNPSNPSLALRPEAGTAHL